MGECERVLGFLEFSMEEPYFLSYNLYYLVSIDSVFTQRRIPNIRTSKGSVALTSSVLTEYRDRTVITTSFRTPESVTIVIRGTFEIDFPALSLRPESFRRADCDL